MALFFGLLALSFLFERGYRLQQQGSTFLVQSGVAAILGLLFCAFTLIVLLRDNRSDYPSFRCSLATMLWGLSCFPIFALVVIVVRDLCR